MDGQSRTNRRGALTRDALLEAGEEELLGLNLAELFATIGATRVSRAAGMASQSAFFHHFGDQDGWVEALARHLLRNEAGPVADKVEDALRELAGELGSSDRPDWYARLQAVSDLDWALLRSDLRPMQRQMAVWLGRHQPLREPGRDEAIVGDLVARSYEEFLKGFEATYRDVLAAWGRKIRPDFTLGQVATVLAALAEGLLIRHAVDPDAVPDDLFGRVVTCLVPVVTTDQRDRSTTAEYVARLAATSRPVSEGRRTAFLDAAERLLERRSWAVITISEIADEAGLPPSVAYDEMGPKEAVAVELWRRFESTLADYVDELAEREVGGPPLHVLRLAIGRFVELARHDRALTHHAAMSIVAELGGDDDGEGLGAQVLAPFLRQAQRQGHLRAEVDTDRVAQDVATMVPVIASARPGDTAPELAAYLFDLVGNGVAADVVT